MAWEVKFLIALFLIIIIGSPLAWSFWTIHTARKNRERSQQMVFATFFTPGLPIHVMCHKQGLRVIPPKEVRKPIFKDDEGPGYYIFKEDCKISDLWPPGKSKQVQVPMPHLYYVEGNPNPLKIDTSMTPETSDIMIKAISDEKSLVALLARMKEDASSPRSIEEALRTTLKFGKYQLVASIITAFLVLGSIIMTLLAMNKVQTAIDIGTQIKNGIGIN